MVEWSRVRPMVKAFRPFATVGASSHPAIPVMAWVRRRRHPGMLGVVILGSEAAGAAPFHFTDRLDRRARGPGPAGRGTPGSPDPERGPSGGESRAGMISEAATEREIDVTNRAPTPA
jgi:hypothetical protein